MILEIHQVFLWLEFSPSLTLGKIEHFETGSYVISLNSIQNLLSFFGQAVFLQATTRFVWDGHFDEARIQGRRKVLIAKMHSISQGKCRH